MTGANGGAGPNVQPGRPWDVALNARWRTDYRARQDAQARVGSYITACYDNLSSGQARRLHADVPAARCVRIVSALGRAWPGVASAWMARL